MIRLRDEKVLEIDAELLCVLRIQRMFRIDERRHAAGLLRLGNHLQCKCGFTGRLGTEDLDDAAAGKAANAERIVDADGAGGDRLHRCDSATLAEAHDGTFAELLFNLAYGDVDGAGAFLEVVERHVNSSFLGGRSCLSADLPAFAMLRRARHYVMEMVAWMGDRKGHSRDRS